ncbi:PTS system glucose-specific IIC component [Mycoplasmopsis mustelae]|uniref:PTS system glucose-specific IIC component n=1 Tax=Mycoplasmopsis mustelae TaxID=171289 RepID=A0A4R7UE67_9BACT|nr:PTS transporter subunit IIABC [Mycoplasmopsis mustelae]TDV24133.1 PTS system glucose-specific IIC component [Mycoplasmopsis mustelae]
MKSIKLLFKSRNAKVDANKKLNNSNSGKARKVLSKISGAFMLPISVMSIAGLFLGIGAAIFTGSLDKDGNVVNYALSVFGNAIKALGDPVFAALPILFATAFVIAFTDEAGVGVFATIVAFLIFLSVQSVFIWEFYEKVPTKNLVTGKVTNVNDIKGYIVLFSGGGRNPESMKNLIGNTLGIRSLQTSVFGGIAVGLMVQYLYNKFHTIQLPQVISFFGGKRFVSLIAIPSSFVLALIFLLFWPWIGVGLNKFGESLGKVPYGFESLIFGVIERSLIPFGLHHVFYAPLWYSNAGGDINSLLTTWYNAESAKPGFEAGQSLITLKEAVAAEPSKFQGDSTSALSLLNFGSTVDWKVGKDIRSVQLFDFIASIGMKIGRFTDGKFAFMILGLPAAAAAMILAAPKENRKVALGTVLPAGFTAMLTGVTEPIEFTFLFLAPWLFWGFHALMAGLSFMFANLASVHIPQAFSGGLLDFISYGIIPVSKGTHFWWSLVIGLGYVPIYFVVFYFSIKKFDLATPGRGGNTKLFNKADFLKKSFHSNEEFKDLDMKAVAIVEGFGGLDNITAFNNCASRLRYDVKDVSKVDVEKLKKAGAFGVKFEGGNHAQAIMGPASEQLNAKIKSQRSLIAKYEAALVNNPEALESQVEKNQEKLNETQTSVQTEMPSEVVTSTKSVKIQTAAKGKLVALEDLRDGVFSEKLMGNGFAVEFDAEKIGNVYAPISGQIVSVFPSKHAIGITSKEGVQVLVHIGIDTVKLNGEGFVEFVKVGDKVKAGDKLVAVDLELLKQHNLRSDVIVIILNEGTMSNFSIVEDKTTAETTSDLIGRVR